ncbi:hypothetical protein ExPECSC037_03581 [Escherichia coli]|nr:hypothetical protein ExPECSC037_03581 [Escherichia coli]
MSKKYQPLLITHYMSTWVTITEAVEITTKAIKQKITPSDIYRHALSGNILLSVYFQSPVILKNVRNVRPGDELDVPAQVSEKNLTPPPGNSSGNLEQQIASTSQLIGSLLAEDMNSEQAANIARGWASSQASGVMTDWLSRFGTARITLGVDEDFSLKNSRDGNPRKWRFDATNSELCAERHEC